MAEQSLKPIIDKLENLFSKFNEKFYGGELQKPSMKYTTHKPGHHERGLWVVYFMEGLEQQRAESDFRNEAGRSGSYEK